MVPRLNDRMHLGRNTVSSPSVLAIRRTCRERFDESLQWLMDVEYYHRLHVAHGDPVILPETLVATAIAQGGFWVPFTVVCGVAAGAALGPWRGAAVKRAAA